MNKAEIIQDLYNAVLLTAGAVGVSMVSKRVAGQPLAAPASLKETAKLAVAVAVGSFLVKKGQSTGYIPTKINL